MDYMPPDFESLPLATRQLMGWMQQAHNDAVEEGSEAVLALDAEQLAAWRVAGDLDAVHLVGFDTPQPHSPLLLAVEMGRLPWVQALIAAGANPNPEPAPGEWSEEGAGSIHDPLLPLAAAIRSWTQALEASNVEDVRRCSEVVHELLAAGADPSLPRYSGDVFPGLFFHGNRGYRRRFGVCCARRFACLARKHDRRM